MNKYAVELKETLITTRYVEVMADNEDEAREIAETRFEESSENGDGTTLYVEVTDVQEEIWV